MNQLYKEILAAEPIAPRGVPTREMLNVTMEFGYGQERIEHPLFNDNSEYLKKELQWYARGKFNDLSIVNHAKIWKGHVTPDGKLWSNYGAWLWGDMLENPGLIQAVKMVRADRNTRRAVAYIGKNELVFEYNRDVPCTMGLQFIVRNDQLYTRVWMRSQDVYLGLRNDLVAFWFFARVFAKLTESVPYRLYIQVGSLHLYDVNAPKVQAAVDSGEEILLLAYDYGNLVESLATKIEPRL